MKCKCCGYETNPKDASGEKMYKYSPRFCSMICQARYEDRTAKGVEE